MVFSRSSTVFTYSAKFVLNNSFSTIRLHVPLTWPFHSCSATTCAAPLAATRHSLLQPAVSAAGPPYGSSRCSHMLTKFASFTELPLPSVSFTVYSSKRQTSWPTCTASILFTRSRSTLTFLALFHLSLQLPSQQFLSFPPLLLATRHLLLPSNTHHRSLPPHKHPRPPPHHHRYHNPSESASLHHPSMKMLIGMLGIVMPTFASWNSKPILASGRTGITLPAE